jgi:hypothetical protein
MMSSKFRRQVFAVLALSGGLATAADAGIVFTLTDNGDNTIGFSMSGDFTIYANDSEARSGLYGTYFGANNGTISNAEINDAVTQFSFDYVDAGGDASGGVAAAFGSGAYAASAYTGTGHVFQNFTNKNFFIDQALTGGLSIGGAVTGGAISGVSASGTYTGSFATFGITEGTVVTKYGADSSNYDTITINTVAASSAVPGPMSLAFVGAGLGLSRRRRSR